MIFNLADFCKQALQYTTQSIDNPVICDLSPNTSSQMVSSWSQFQIIDQSMCPQYGASHVIHLDVITENNIDDVYFNICDKAQQIFVLILIHDDTVLLNEYFEIRQIYSYALDDRWFSFATCINGAIDHV